MATCLGHQNTQLVPGQVQLSLTFPPSYTRLALVSCAWAAPPQIPMVSQGNLARGQCVAFLHTQTLRAAWRNMKAVLLQGLSPLFHKGLSLFTSRCDPRTEWCETVTRFFGWFCSNRVWRVTLWTGGVFLLGSHPNWGYW